MKRKLYGNEVNFITFTIVDWIDVFTRRLYKDFIIDNLIYCVENKNLKIYAYVIMTNHIHLVAQSNGSHLSNIIRDFKSYSSKKLIKMIKNNMCESRRHWMLEAFKNQGWQNSANEEYQFWQNGSYPVALYSNKVTEQKIDYIHQNPVKAGFVDRAEKYYYNSANPANPLKLGL